MIDADETLETLALRAVTLRQREALLPRVLALAEAVARAHALGLVHAELRPEGVRVGAFGVVLDWGCARELGGLYDDRPWPELRRGELARDVAFMAPEQVTGGHVDARVDVYAIAAVAYRVLAGEPPYAHEAAVTRLHALMAGPPVPLARRVPGLGRVTALIDRAMAWSPHERPQDAGVLVYALREVGVG